VWVEHCLTSVPHPTSTSAHARQSLLLVLGAVSPCVQRHGGTYRLDWVSTRGGAGGCCVVVEEGRVRGERSEVAGGVRLCAVGRILVRTERASGRRTRVSALHKSPADIRIVLTGRSALSVDLVARDRTLTSKQGSFSHLLRVQSLRG
jgi:hypothetical protein